MQEEIIKKLETEGFFKHNNYKIEKLTSDEVILKTNIEKESLNPYGIAHGGFIYGLGDTLMGILAAIDGRKAVTLDANITYLSPGIGKYLIAKGSIVKNGKTVSHLKADIYNDKNKHIATMSSNYFYIN